MSNPQTKTQLLEMLTQADSESIIKIMLILRKMSQTDLSTKLGITSSEISRVISGKRKTSYIRAAIAAELGIQEQVLFDGKGEDASAAVNPSPEAANLFKARVMES